MSALAGLPDAVFAIAPELRQLDGLSEPRADCSACPLAVPAAQLEQQPHMFHSDARCCTYHPELPNWLAGRALRDPDAAPRLRARLQDPAGLTPESLAPRARSYVSRHDFGRELSLRCPYWAGGELACGAWAHRAEVCRTWHCRFSDGDRSRTAWADAKRLMHHTFARMSYYCTLSATPPPEGAAPERMEAWYLHCAQLIDDTPLDLIATLRDEAVAHAGQRLLSSLAALGQPLPDVLVAAIAHVGHQPDGTILLAGDTLRDTVTTPGDIFRFIGRLDGQTPWRDALAAAHGDGLQFSEADVEHLYRLNVLRPPRSKTLDPGAQLVVNGQVIHPDP